MPAAIATREEGSPALTDLSSIPTSRSPAFHRAGFAAVLAFGMAAASFQQFALGSLAPWIIDDLGLTRTEYGFSTGLLFAVGALVAPLVGRLVDRLGGRRTLLLLFLGAFLSTAVMAGASSYALLLLATAIGGFGMAAGNPSTNHLVVQHVRRGEQGLIMGVKQAGPQMAAMATGLFLPTGALIIGWRPVMGISAVLMASGAALTLLLVPGHDGVATEPSTDPSATESAAENRTVRWLAAYGFLMGAGLAGIFAYLPLYAFERLGYSQDIAGRTLLVMGAAGLLAVIAWGRAAERRATASGPLAVLSAGAALAIVLIELAAHVVPELIWMGVVGLAITAMPWHVVGMFAVIRAVGRERAGRAAGLVLLAVYVGFMLSPIAIGYSVDRLGDYTVAWAGVALAFASAAMVAAAWHRSDRRHGTDARIA